MNGTTFIRWTGLAALGAGLIFAGIQPIHPPDVLASVTTSAWTAIMPVKLAMCLLFLLGTGGLYARQVDKAGWLGLAGYLLFSLSWALQTAFVFAEAFILPTLATAAPTYVESFLGIVNGAPGTLDVDALATLYTFAGILYVLGGLLLGIATFRARVLPRWAGGLLAFAAVSPVVLAALPHPLDRTLGVPMGVAFLWLGYALWSERPARAAEAVPSRGTPHLGHRGAE